MSQPGVDCEIHGPNRPVIAPKPGLKTGGGAAGVHVLLVDDERLTRTVVANLLHKCGYRVTSASDGMEALQLLRGSAPDTFQLVLTDVCMPELNGIQLLSCVKQDANLRAVPVVMMSSVDQEETVAECVQQGAEEYLVKPVTKKEVQHIWQHVWRKRCAAATVPQLPVEAAAAAAAGEAEQQQEEEAAAADTAQAEPAVEVAQQPAAAAEQQQQQQQQPAAPAQDVQQPAATNEQQQQQQGDSLDMLLRSSAQDAAGSLPQRQLVFTSALNLLHAAHLQRQPLLGLRPSRLRFSHQNGLIVQAAAAGPAEVQQQQQAQQAAADAEVDALYTSPEEAAGQPTCQSDMFSLGLLFIDLFFPCTTHEQRCAQLRAARAAVLPPVLTGAHTTSNMQAVQDLLMGLLQADPARRPTVHGVVRAGIVQDAYRLVQQLPHWRLLSVARQQQQQPAVALPVAAAAAPAVAAGPARAARQRASVAAVAVLQPEDQDAVRHFLLLLRKAKQQEMQQTQAQLAALDSDIGSIKRQHGCSAVASSPGGGLTPAAAAAAEQGAVEQPQPPSKRARLAADDTATAAAAAALEAPPLEQQQRVSAAMAKLEEMFFQRRQQQSTCQLGHLSSFARDLNALAAHSRLELQATLRSGDLASPVEMACCAAFDRDDEYFATVGVSRRVKIFNFAACLEGEGNVLHYPALQITTRSKLSSVSWNSYVKSQLITSDYSGLIQLWDAATAGEVQQYDEHARRVWSVDFSTTDPMRFLSGSDDGSVRLWSMHEPSSVARIAAPANVCSVQFSPADSHTIAFGCANYRVYMYDLRHTAHPLAVISGPQRAVSYVRFMGGSHLVSASTDSTLRLWDLREVLSASSAASASAGSSGASCGAAVRPACTYTGHRNQRNFVGLSVSADGHIVCGSEDNAAYCYYRSLPFSTAQYRFSPADAVEGHQPFVSAVCWANRSKHCLAANSQGLLQVLKLQ